MALRCLQWDCDHLFFHFSDFYASLLDSATEHNPSVLTWLSLDISSLTEVGLAYMQQVLARSDLEYLCILCTSLEPVLEQSITQVLASVPWHTLKKLVLTGENIDGWLRYLEYRECSSTAAL